MLSSLPPLRPHSRRLLLVIAALAALAALAAVACGGHDGSPDAAHAVPTRIAFTATDSALVGESAALDAKAVDANGRTASGYAVTYTSSDTNVARVDAGGHVRFVGPGVAHLALSVTGAAISTPLSAATDVTVLTPVASLRVRPSRLDLAPGAHAVLGVNALDAAGNVVPSYPLSYAIKDGAVATVAGGVVTAVAAGVTTVNVSAQFRGRSASAAVDVGVAPVTAGAFTINLVPVGTVDPRFAAVFQQAAAFWQGVITAALPVVRLNIPAGTCGAGTPAVSQYTSGLVIMFSVDSIDGPLNILGQAGPCVLRSAIGGSQPGLPSLGIMQFDSADVATLLARGYAYDVIRHEMGHVLGIGTLWSVSGPIDYLAGAGTADPEYTGPSGVGASAVLGFTNTGATVPVENTGGPGTADGHWRTSVYRPELMVGYLAANVTTHPASRLTVLSLADLGYAVNAAASEPLLPPGATSSALAPYFPPRALGGRRRRPAAPRRAAPAALRRRRGRRTPAAVGPGVGPGTFRPPLGHR